MNDKRQRKKLKTEEESKNELKEIKSEKCEQLYSKNDTFYEASSSTFYSSNNHNSTRISIKNIKNCTSDNDEDGICKENFNDWKLSEHNFLDKKIFLNRVKNDNIKGDTANDEPEISTSIHIQPFISSILPNLKDHRDMRSHRKGGRRASTNCRERVRQQNVNEAFQELRSKVPTDPPDKKLSKCTILTRAIEYIRVLDKVLKYQEREEHKFFKQCEMNGDFSFVNTYVDKMSDKIQKSRENNPIMINCEINGINFEEVKKKTLKNNADNKSLSKNDKEIETETKGQYVYELDSSVEISSPSTLSSPSDTE